MSHAFSLEPVLILLIAAVLVAVIFQRLKVSPILGYLVAGALIGEHGLDLFEDQEAAAGLGELGVVFLLFVIGLELSFARLRVIRRRLFGLGVMQVGLTALAIAAGCYFWAGERGSVAVLVGGGLALSSTAMVMQLLVERGEISSRAGRAAFAILLVQDLAAIPLLALLPILAASGGGPGDTYQALLSAGLNGVAAIVVILLIGRFVLRPVYRIVAAAQNNTLFVALSLFVVLGVGFITELAGLSMTLGAFLAGVMLAETQYRHQIEADIEPFRGLLLALFFINVGLSINVFEIMENWLPILTLTVSLLVFKIVVIFSLGLAIRLPIAIAGHVAILLSQGGEFAFVLFGAATVLGIIPAPLAGLLITVVAITMVVTPLLAPLGAMWGEWLRDHDVSPDARLAGSETEELHNHVIIAGFGRTGRTVARMLAEAREPFVIIDLNIENVTLGREQHLPVFYGDAGRQSVLESAGIDRARALILTVDSVAGTERMTTSARRINPGLRIVARARDHDHAEILVKLGADMAIPELEEGSLRLGGAAMHTVGKVEDEIERVLADLRSDDYAKLRGGAAGIDDTPTGSSA